MGKTVEVFEAIPEILRGFGVRHVFGVLGHDNVNWVASGVENHAFEFIHARHEEAALHAAAGYSRSTGELGVCTVVRGPGFANAVNGLVTAAYNHVPLLLVVGESPVKETPAENHSDQNIPQREIADLVGAGFVHVSEAAALELAARDAVIRARRYGKPQVLSLRNGILRDSVTLRRPSALLEVRQEPDHLFITKAVELLEESRRPLILAGQGALLSNAQSSLAELADTVGARLCTTLPAHAMFAGHPHDLGISGGWSVRGARELMMATDLLIAFGTSLNPRTTDLGRLYSRAAVVQCGMDDRHPRTTVTPKLVIRGDARLIASALLEEWRIRGLPVRQVHGRPSPSWRTRREEFMSVPIGHDPARGLDVRRVAAAFERKLPLDRVVVTDSGRAVGPVTAIVGAADARSWLAANSNGCVGRGIGTAIGAAVANPSRHIALFTGDGGFMMGISGLDTIASLELQVTIIVLNDQQFGSEVVHLRDLGQSTEVLFQRLPNVVELARAYGGVGSVISTMSDLKRLTVGQSRLEIVDVRIDPELDAQLAF